MSGSSLVFPDRHMSADRLARIINDHKVTIAAGVPTILSDLLRYLDDHRDTDFSSLRMMPCGGSSVPLAIMSAFEERYGVAVRQMWGMTEVSPMGAAAWPPLNAPDSERWQLRNTAGRLLCGVEGRIVDDEGHVLASDGASVGELEVRGPWVTGSYYRGNDSEMFRDGWLRTGDVGFINPRGYITLTDRAKDLIKSGGEWISSVELENHLMAHPGVLEACVVAVPDPRWQERPFAAVVLQSGAEINAAHLRHFLSKRDNMARWHLPERWAFVDQVPRTGVGKYDKKLIRSRYADGAYEVITCHD
jgi:fatty-acyl-CoA synthase